MIQPPRISEAEWEVMEILWQHSPLTALEVVQHLSHRTEWKDQTIRTMLSRLVRKKAVTYKATGKFYHYRPLIKREQCVQAVSQSFLERIFDGATGALLLHFAKNKTLSPKDLAELEAVLRQKKKEK